MAATASALWANPSSSDDTNKQEKMEAFLASQAVLILVVCLFGVNGDEKDVFGEGL